MHTVLYTKVAMWSEQGKEPFDTSSVGETEILICRQTASQRWQGITTEIQRKAAGEEVGTEVIWMESAGFWQERNAPVKQQWLSMAKRPFST